MGDPINVDDPTGLCSWYDLACEAAQHEQAIEDAAFIAYDVLEIAALATGVGWLEVAAHIAGDVSSSIGLFTSCKDGFGNFDCESAVGGLALSAVRLWAPASDVSKVGEWVVTDLSEVTDLILEVLHNSSSSSSSSSSHSSSGGGGNSSSC